MGFWKTTSTTPSQDIERYHYYFTENDFFSNKYQMSLNSVDLLGRTLYVVNANIGLFEEARHQFWASTSGQAKKIAEKWFKETYTKHLEELENDLLYTREMMNKIM